MIYIALLFLIFPSKARIPFVIDVESKCVTLSRKPVMGDTVTAVFQVIPKETKENLKVIFFGFEGTKPVTTDTVFLYNAQKGEKGSFSVDIVYLSSPAIFKAKITNSRGRPNGLGVYRYLMDVKTKQYGNRRDIQIHRPIEYRFNTEKRYFEREIFRFENDRWTRNRNIIDSIQKIDEGIPDSLALVLYADIPKAIYPKRINEWLEKAKHLLQEGWSGDLNESDRNKFFTKLNQKILEEEQRVSREKQSQRNKDKFLWFLYWHIPAMGLIAVLICLLRLRKRVSLRSITPTIFDKFVKYSIYLFVIGAAICFAYPYLLRDNGMHRKREVRRIKKENREIVEKIENLDILKSFQDYTMAGKCPIGTKYGTGACFKYKDTTNSKLNVVYHFFVKVYPTKEGAYKISDSDYDLEEIIGGFEKNAQVEAFVTKLHIEKVNLERRGDRLLVSINDTIVKGNEKYPINLQFDNRSGIITNFSVPAYFTDFLFPELDILRRRCQYAGYPIRHDKCIKYKYYGKSKQHEGYAALVNNGGSDTLWMWFSCDKPEDIGYKWIPVPRMEPPPAAIIEHLYYEFEKAGLPYAYLKDHLQIISSLGMRKPDYFKGEGDKAILQAQIKWKTGYEWVDECNNGKGVRFVVSYEYFGKSEQLGRCLGKPGKRKVGKWKNINQKRFYLKPITQLISENEAREKLYSFLPENRVFSSIFVEIRIPERKDELDNFVYLVGNYSPSQGKGAIIKVNLETGDVKQTFYPIMYLTK